MAVEERWWAQDDDEQKDINPFDLQITGNHGLNIWIPGPTIGLKQVTMTQMLRRLDLLCHRDIRETIASYLRKHPVIFEHEINQLKQYELIVKDSDTDEYFYLEVYDGLIGWHKCDNPRQLSMHWSMES